MTDSSPSLLAILFSRLWPVLVLLALFVGGIYFARFLVKRWKAM